MYKYEKITDMHTHTDNSFDGNHSAVHMCESAINKGVKAIAFTDHCEVDAFEKGNYERSVRQAFFEVSKARSAFIGDLLILNGIELGQPHYDVATSEKIISSQQFDVIIGSVHNLRNREDPYYIKDFSNMDVNAFLREYFEEIRKMVMWGNFDILAHLTYPFRYLYSRNKISVDINEYKDQVDRILRAAAEKDIALEINTAGLRQPIKKLSPEAETVKRFKELGGKYITIGSDAHYAQDIASGFAEAAEAAKYAGFNHTVIFQRRQPIEIPLS
jgi:histidinol-phosphatase (PHP family)